MKIRVLFRTLFQTIHAWFEDNDAVSLFSEKRNAVRLAFQLSEAPLNASTVEKEKRQLINRDADPALILSLMKFS